MTEPRRLSRSENPGIGAHGKRLVASLESELPPPGVPAGGRGLMIPQHASACHPVPQGTCQLRTLTELCSWHLESRARKGQWSPRLRSTPVLEFVLLQRGRPSPSHHIKESSPCAPRRQWSVSDGDPNLLSWGTAASGVQPQSQRCRSHWFTPPCLSAHGNICLRALLGRAELKSSP